MAEVAITYRGITFNTNFTAGTDIYMLTDIPEGFQSPQIRETENVRQGQHGITDQISWYGKRSIVLTGKVISNTQAGRKVMENNIRSIFALDGVQTNVNASYYTMYITDEDGTEKQIDVKVSIGVEFSKVPLEANRRDFIVTLKARDPRMFSQTLNSQDLAEAFDATTFMLPTMLPFSLDPQTVFVETLTNDGNFASPPIITLSGIATNPRIINNTTGVEMKLNTTMTTGDEIIIDVGSGTIEKNGIDILSTLDSTSQWLYLAAGDNEIELRDDTTPLEYEANFQWRSAYI